MSDTQFLHMMLYIFGGVLVLAVIAIPIPFISMAIMDRFQSGFVACLVLVGNLFYATAVGGAVTYGLMRSGWLT